MASFSLCQGDLGEESCKGLWKEKDLFIFSMKRSQKKRTLKNFNCPINGKQKNNSKNNKKRQDQTKPDKIKTKTKTKNHHKVAFVSSAKGITLGNTGLHTSSGMSND